ncbi:MAG: hypothetical protein J2P25_05150 [Nocardiopsaceae bacterium]|nr:hypothetical protein [Nocardiopsaceae bacterium]
MTGTAKSAVRRWASVLLTLFSWILIGLDAACFRANDNVVNAQDNLLYTYADPEGSAAPSKHCGQLVGLSPSSAAELHTVVTTAIVVLVLTGAWCVLRLVNRASWQWVLGTGLALAVFTLFNIMAAHATLTTAPVRMVFGCS